MRREEENKVDFAGIGGMRRRTVTVTQDSVVRLQLLQAGSPLPALLEPSLAGIDPIAWVAGNAELVRKLLLTHGGLLFRGFSIQGEQDLERFISALSGELLEY